MRNENCPLEGLTLLEHMGNRHEPMLQLDDRCEEARGKCKFTSHRAAGILAFSQARCLPLSSTAVRPRAWTEPHVDLCFHDNQSTAQKRMKGSWPWRRLLVVAPRSRNRQFMLLYFHHLMFRSCESPLASSLRMRIQVLGISIHSPPIK